MVVPGVDATCIPVGKGSLTETFVNDPRSDAEAEITSVKVDVAFGAIVVGAKALVIVGAAFPEMTSDADGLTTLLLFVQPPPTLFDTETVKVVVPGGVAAVVLIVRVVVVLPLETVAGLKEAVVPAGCALQFTTGGFDTQPCPVPAHPVVIGKLAEEPCGTGLGV